MTSEVIKGHLKISKYSFSAIYSFYKMKYGLKGHPRSYKTTFMPKSF